MATYDDTESLPYHRKYRPNTLMGYIGNDKLKVTAMSALKSGRRPQVILLYGDSGCGKAQPLDSLVLTVDGFKRMGDIEVGDIVFTKEGNRGSISGIYPQGLRPVYRITLSDRTCIEVSDEHLNCVYRYNTRKQQREDYVLTTLELIDFFKNSKYKLRVDAPCVDWNKREVPLDPYILGALIGDGSLSSGCCNFSNAEMDVLEKVNGILFSKYNLCLSLIEDNKCDYRISSVEKSKYKFITCDGKVYHGCTDFSKYLTELGYPRFDNGTLVNICNDNASVIFSKYPELKGIASVHINENFTNKNYVKDVIKELGLDCKSTEKFIPECYLYNSYEVRVELLRGLFDTDGTISKTGQVEFSTSSKRLSDDFSFLVRSLGVRDVISEKKSGYKRYDGTFIECNLSYRHFLKIPNSLLFYTSRKHSEMYSLKQTDPIRNIVSIEYIGDKECQCIMVDHPDHTYISDYFIPTHNTTFARLLAKEYSCEERDDEEGACNECINCQIINEYILTGSTDNMTNIQEIDIADQSGKRDLEPVIADMELPSFGNSWKIYIFDEVHVASEGLQNRLLKTAEEPPENVLMILCTTNPERLLPTLRNRCQLQLRVTKPKLNELAGLLKSVCQSEGVDYDMDGLRFIVNRSEFTIRTALQNLFQVVTEQNSAKLENVKQVFDDISINLLAQFFGLIKKKDTLGYVTLLSDIKSKMDLDVFLKSLEMFVRNGVYIINGIQPESVTEGEMLVYRDLFGDMGVADIASVLSRILSFNTRNLEMEMLLWGYSGLKTSVIEEQKSVFESEIIDINKELVQEQKNADKEIKKRNDEDYQRGVENASNKMGAVNMDALLEMGVTLIE